MTTCDVYTLALLLYTLCWSEFVERMYVIKVKAKSKVHPRTANEGPDGE
jgi:hypothetical protein